MSDTVTSSELQTGTVIKRPVLDKGYVELIQTDISDLKVVNAARVSFHKQRANFVSDADLADLENIHGKKSGYTSDEALIRFLAKNKHWAPFAHCRQSFVFDFHTNTSVDFLVRFFSAMNNAGFEVSSFGKDSIVVGGSLFGFFKSYADLYVVPYSDLCYPNLLNCINPIPCGCGSQIGSRFAEILLWWRKRCPYSSNELAKILGISWSDVDRLVPHPQNYPENHIVFEPLVKSDADPMAILANKASLPFLQETGKHICITLKVKAPVFVRTQLFKHKQGFMESEVSRRYVKSDPEFYEPIVWRAAPEGSIKQGSGGIIKSGHNVQYEDHIHAGRKLYNDLVESNYAPEQVRGILAQSMYTEWFWTASVSNYLRMWGLRAEKSAQQETQEYARAIGSILDQVCPVYFSEVLVHQGRLSTNHDKPYNPSETCDTTAAV